MYSHIIHLDSVTQLCVILCLHMALGVTGSFKGTVSMHFIPSSDFLYSHWCWPLVSCFEGIDGIEGIDWSKWQNFIYIIHRRNVNRSQGKVLLQFQHFLYC